MTAFARIIKQLFLIRDHVFTVIVNKFSNVIFYL